MIGGDVVILYGNATPGLGFVRRRMKKEGKAAELVEVKGCGPHFKSGLFEIF